AYLAILNSMILRVPLAAKRFLAPPLFAAEGLVQRLQGKATSCVALGRWQKLASCPDAP
ncbi:MAG: hypothetical protein JRI97_04720, partial [Deltaproteobacteria bacterium]|nr:hypothetical protein [Deltaproteobacteria bacterium]